ncbi:uncharacterized protein LOC133190733 [Saccostrea echinata]|uniref:uncharacterized protein LOC133190733 n=1 Tax=Saccostrea echinata TaxID=191078 RepID=UPI002A8366A1|nr:uncharacterized protein LOC133190733 [Saccostrea echinata]
MAQSKSNIPDKAQHFLECGIEDCERNCEFYCNPCHQEMCKQCRDEHLRNPKTKNHEVVIYQLRKRQLPVKKCKIHSTKEIDLLCKECQIPLCAKCAATQEHEGHGFTDLETIYAEKFTLCQEENFKVQEYFLPTSQDLQKEIKEDVVEIKRIMDNLRTSMNCDVESLKSMIDKLQSENMKQLDQIEQSLLEDLKTQDKTFDNYIIYLNNLIKEFHGFLCSSDPTEVTGFSLVDMKIQPIPETTKPLPPVFTTGKYDKEDVAKLMGKISTSKIKPKTRKIKPLEVPSPQSPNIPTDEQLKSDKWKFKFKVHEALPLTYSQVKKFIVPGVKEVFHMSLDQSDKLRVSDLGGKLVQTDLQGNLLQKIKTSEGYGYHTVTQTGDLIFTDKDKKVINRITLDNNITKAIKTGAWRPLSIHSSHINGDILVGMIFNAEAKVTRYNKKGKELQIIQKDNKGEELYSLPHYIAENINGDICTSDVNKKQVVVVDKLGQHRFSYTGDRSRFCPFGICTDIFGHILVCDKFKIHILNQDGKFLSLLLTLGLSIDPSSVCVDDKNNLYVGADNSALVVMYNYLDQ